MPNRPGPVRRNAARRNAARRSAATGVLLSVVLSVVLSAALSACAGTEAGDEATPPGAGGPATSRTTPQVVNPTIVLPRTTAPEPAEGAEPWPLPVISKLEMTEPGECAGDQATMTATYETTGADRVVFVVDDVQLDQPIPTSGTHELPVACGRMTHFVLMIAVNPDNKTVTERRTTVGH